MTRTELARGTATFLAVTAAGFLSTISVDRHYGAAGDRNRPDALSPASTACVEADGSWKNWVWANVPMLSPKCAPDR
jgi:hypothetical protein